MIIENKESEIWRDIPEYEGLYKVSTLGRIKSLPRNGTVKYERLLKPSRDKDGYFKVSLSKGNSPKHYRLHRLVAMTFIPNIDSKPCVDHINTVITDNNVNNLRWSTYNENNNNPLTLAKQIGQKRSLETRKKMSIKSKRANNSRARKIVQYTLGCEIIRTWECINDAADSLGISHSSISECCRRNLKYKNENINKISRAKGFIWEYF